MNHKPIELDDEDIIDSLRDGLIEAITSNDTAELAELLYQAGVDIALSKDIRSAVNVMAVIVEELSHSFDFDVLARAGDARDTLAALFDTAFVNGSELLV
jgi:hypothetical protein